jgi:hypothetical protein
MSNERLFDPVLLLYLNPELSVDSQYNNITTVEQAYDFYHSSNANGLWSTLDAVPPLFDEGVYISDNKNVTNISDINLYIRAALSNDSTPIEDIERDGKYYPTIYRDVYLRGRNNFVFNLPGDLNPYSITSSNLNVGDWVKLVKNGSEFHYACVSGIPNNQTFTLSNKNYAFTDSNASYLVFGIKLYDPLRLARISYLRQYATLPSPPTTSYVNLDTDFNFELYTILYPDTRLLDRETAFVDYMCRRDNEDVRIARTRDIKAMGTTSTSNTSTSNAADSSDNIEYLRVNHHLDLNFGQNTGRVTWDGLNLFYATANDFRPATDIPPYFDGIITERGIKTYVDRPYLTTATFNDVIVQGFATFCNFRTVNAIADNLQVNSNAVMLGPATFCNIVTCEYPVVANNTMTLNSNLLAAGTTAFTGPATFCNIVTCEYPVVANNAMTLNSNLLAAGTTAFTGPTTFCNMVTCEYPVVANNTMTLNSNLLAAGIAAFTGPSAIFRAPVGHHSNVSHHSTTNFQDTASFYSNLESHCNAYFYTSMTKCNICAYMCASNVRIKDVQITNALIADVSINAMYASNIYSISNSVSNITAKDAKISNLHANDADVSNLDVIRAQIADLEVDGFSLFHSNVEFLSNLQARCDIENYGSLLSGNICIMDMSALSTPSYQAPSNLVVDNAHINATLSVNGATHIGTPSTLSNVMLVVNGILEATNFDTTSDSRLKENVVPMDCGSVANRMEHVTPYHFNYKNKPSNKRRIGFIAQEVEQVFPEAVSTVPIYSIPVNKVTMVKYVAESQVFLCSLPNHKFVVGDELVVSLNHDCNSKTSVVVAQVTGPDAFELACLPVGTATLTVECLVYKNIKTVDYHQVTAVMFAAIKDLSFQLVELKHHVSKLSKFSKLSKLSKLLKTNNRLKVRFGK